MFFNLKELNIIIAENITRLRTAKQLTQLELANMLSYSDKSVSKWERGESIPDAYVLKKISEIFSVSIDFIFTEHRDEEFRKKPIRKYKHDRGTITKIVICGIWTLALALFVIFNYLGYTQWLIFAYTLPVTLVVLIILNSIWGNRKHNVFVISGLVWSSLLAIYLTFLSANIWKIFLLGIPAQVIIYLSFRIKKKQS